MKQIITIKKLYFHLPTSGLYLETRSGKKYFFSTTVESYMQQGKWYRTAYFNKHSNEFKVIKNTYLTNRVLQRYSVEGS